MSEERKMISVSKIDEIIKERDNASDELDWYGETILVNRRLNLSDMLDFVGSVVGGCFTSDGQYMPEAKEFVIRCAVLQFFGNFRMPENIEKRYETVYSDPVSSAYADILNVIDRAQMTDIRNAIDAKIEYIVHSNIEVVNRQLNVLSDAVEELGKSLGGVFGDMTEEDAKALIQNLTQGVDEGKLMEAYMTMKKEPKAEEAEAQDDGE